MKRFLAALIVYPLMALLVIAGAIAFMIMPKGGATIAGIADSLWKLYKNDSPRKPTKEEIEEQRHYEEGLQKQVEQQRKDELDKIAFHEFVKEKLASEENRRLVREQGLEYYKIIKKEFESRKAA